MINMTKIHSIKTALNHYRNDPHRKSLPKTILEATRCFLMEKEIPFYYFQSLLYKKDCKNYLDYIGHKKLNNIRDNIIVPNDYQDVNAKLDSAIIAR